MSSPHATLQAALKAKIVTLVGTVPVLDFDAAEEADFDRLASFVGIVFEDMTADSIGEHNPTVSAVKQRESWMWKLYIAGGGGASTEYGKATAVFDLLTLTRELKGYRLVADGSVGMLHLVAEHREGRHGSGVLYSQLWRHGRYGR